MSTYRKVQSRFYRLGTLVDGDFFTHYFGRSDTDLQVRLLPHVTDGFYTHFQVRKTEDVKRAYELECLDWHLQGDQTPNERHLAKPDGTDFACPYCDFGPRVSDINETHSGIYINAR